MSESRLSQTELQQLRQEYETADFEAWLGQKVANAEAELTDDERSQAEKMGLSPLTYLRNRRPRLEGEDLSARQREEAKKLGVTLPSDFSRPVAWWNSVTASDAAFARAKRAGGVEAVRALADAVAENQALLREGRAASVRIPAVALEG